MNIKEHRKYFSLPSQRLKGDNKIFLWFFILVSFNCSSSNKNFHVSSPEWRDQIVYFLMIDRFNDGDKSNNDFGFDLLRPEDTRFYSGGDIKGVIDKVDYIKEMGATAVWITPPNANMWYSARNGVTGYHGYWPRNFKAIDKRYGNLKTYKILSDLLHTNGMYLIQDIVVNHVGSYFQYKGNKYDTEDTSKYFELIDGNIPDSPPEQQPFDKINRLDKDHAAAAIYHWTPEIMDFYDPVQEFTYQTAGLNDLNSSNPTVQDALKDSFSYWIKEVGVDAYRLDTAKYLDPRFIDSFLNDKDGILAVAASTGRVHFPVFGEIFEMSLPYEDTAEKKLSKFQGTKKNPILNALIGFPLYKSIEEVFRSGKPTSQLSYRINKQMELFNDPYTLLNFIDNHDVKRFYNGYNSSAVKQAFAFIMTVPGIPVIYQGDEQGLLTPREAMFKGGYKSTSNKFDTSSEFFLLLKKLSKIRKSNRSLSRGSIKILADSTYGSGLFAYERKYQGKSIIVIYNTGEHEILASDIKLQPYKYLSALLQKDIGKTIKPNDKGDLLFSIGPRGFGIYEVINTPENNVTLEQKQYITIQNSVNDMILTKSFSINGTSSFSSEELLVVQNANLDTSHVIKTNGFGEWSIDVIVDDYGLFDKSLQLYQPKTATSSAIMKYKTHIKTPQVSAIYIDPIFDDFGPTKNYKKPTEKSYGQQMDFKSVNIYSGGNILKIVLRMEAMGNDWLAPNGFDHVAFSIFFDIPEIVGSNDLPLIQSKSPQGFRWDFGHHLWGWSNILFNKIGASKNDIGEILAVTPTVVADTDAGILTITYRASDFKISNWENVKVYLTTWDFSEESVYRPLKTQPSQWSFSAQIKNSPLILDDMGPFLIP